MVPPPVAAAVLVLVGTPSSAAEKLALARPPVAPAQLPVYVEDVVLLEIGSRDHVDFFLSNVEYI